MRLYALRLALAALVLLSAPAGRLAAQTDDCRQPAPVCAARSAVFPIAAFSPVASAVRLGPDLLVTNRHAVADEPRVELFLADGRMVVAEVVPTDYPGDLVLLSSETLPAGPSLAPASLAEGPLYTVGADVERGAVVAYPPGPVLAPPAEAYPLARLHHGAPTRPGNSGGAMVDGAGRLVAIVASGGEGRYEAVPAGEIARLRAASGADKAAASRRIGAAVRDCFDRLERHFPRPAPLEAGEGAALAEACRATGNRQYYDLAGQILGRAGQSAAATALFEASLAQDPNGVNTRLSLVTTYHIAGDFKRGLAQVRWLIERLPDDARVLRLALQAGKWGEDAALAERALALIGTHRPDELEAARAFYDSDAPPPAPR